MKVTEEMWKYFQDHLGYTDEEMKIFRENPRNVDVVSQGLAIMDKTIVFEVIESHGCHSGHKVGDKFYFDGVGNLLTKLSPKRICYFALNVMAPGIFAANELFYAGVDPNEMRFNRASCFDVGVRCGGWGQIVMEIRVEDRKRD
jgi:uncharacterized repeat protein (TIGR04076 family)